jgi:cytochrome d ubiquinol oxidase subunit II
METLWFCLIAIMITGYVVFDGFDLGAGIVHLRVARDPRERARVLRTIGPVWDGNEVWLLAAGGTLFFAFPTLYASSFSGFYLPLMVVLWLLILRGVSLEFRHHLEGPVWKPLWDVVFSGASILLAIFFGAALGGVVRGVPLTESGYFFEPLWTDFRTGPPTGVIDWYTSIVGIASLLTLAVHGALWIALKTDGPLRLRSIRVGRALWWALCASTVAVTIATFVVQPHVPQRLSDRPWGLLFPLLALAGLFGIPLFLSRRNDLAAFLSSCAYIVGMLTSVAFGIYPFVLPANTDPAYALTVHNAAAAATGLRIGLIWWIPGMLLVAGYFVLLYRRFAGRVPDDAEPH